MLEDMGTGKKMAVGMLEIWVSFSIISMLELLMPAKTHTKENTFSIAQSLFCILYVEDRRGGRRKLKDLYLESP